MPTCVCAIPRTDMLVWLAWPPSAAGGKKTKKKAKKKVASKGAVKLIDEDDDWRTYAPSGQSNIDYVTAERGGPCALCTVCVVLCAPANQ